MQNVALRARAAQCDVLPRESNGLEPGNQQQGSDFSRRSQLNSVALFARRDRIETRRVDAEAAEAAGGDNGAAVVPLRLTHRLSPSGAALEGRGGSVTPAWLPGTTRGARHASVISATAHTGVQLHRATAAFLTSAHAPASRYTRLFLALEKDLGWGGLLKRVLLDAPLEEFVYSEYGD